MLSITLQLGGLGSLIIGILTATAAEASRDSVHTESVKGKFKLGISDVRVKSLREFEGI